MIGDVSYVAVKGGLVMPVFGKIQGSSTDVQLFVPIHEVDSKALTQLRNIASLPWTRHVRAMPDCHLGKGATVGSVIAMKDAISPNAVGVDIGCGMEAVRTSLSASDLPASLLDFRLAVQAEIPQGGEGGTRTKEVKPFDKKLFGEFKDLDAKVQKGPFEKRAHCQMGTLGSGNHFIELCLDNGKCDCENGAVNTGMGYEKCDDCDGTGQREPRVWLMLHSGSRNIGKELAEVHISVAKTLEHNARLPDPELAVILNGTPEMQAYRRDLFWSQRYAAENRKVMLFIYKRLFCEFFEKSSKKVEFDYEVGCHHNYVAEEEHFGEKLFVTRKGAIRAAQGDFGIIPGAMGKRSFIVRGRGNPDSLLSASHGAGRAMSRSAAKKKFTLTDLAESTKGVECRKDGGVLDEIGEAYKDIQKVMEYQADLVEIVAEIRGIMVIKGD